MSRFKSTNAKALPPLLEELEPRLLLSADGLVGLPALVHPDSADFDEAAGRPQPLYAEFNAEQAQNPALTAENGQYTAQRLELVFVDGGIDDCQSLVDNFQGRSNSELRVDVVVLDPSRDGIEQVSTVLAGYSDVNAVHVLAQGDPAVLTLGNAVLDNETLVGYRDAIEGWAGALDVQADLLFYGSNLAAGEDGHALIRSLAELTGADVAVSESLTGAALYIGDWTLECDTGAIDSSVAPSVSSHTQSSPVPAVSAQNSELTREKAVVESVIVNTDSVNLNGVPSESTARHELVLLDPGVQNSAELRDLLVAQHEDGRDLAFFVLDANRDGVEQITEILAQHHSVDAVHVLSHGTAAQGLQLGNTSLNVQTINTYAEMIQAWQQSFSGNADLLLYGCDLAASDAGRSLVTKLGEWTGTDVAASTDLTGSQLFGGDWVLEFQTGRIETAVVANADVEQNWFGLMSVAVDAVSTGSTTGTSLNISHTTSAGSSRLMLVGVSIRETGSTAVSSMTYNGANLNFEGFEVAAGARIEIWSLVAPQIGTNNLVVNLNNAGGGANVGVMTFTGVDQTTPLGAFGSDFGDATSGSAAIDSAAGELVFGVVAVKDSNQDLVPQGSQSEQWDLFIGSEANGGGSTAAGAASVNMGWTWSASTDWAIGGVSIKPGAGNNAPSIGLPGGVLNYTENDPATILDATATASDSDSANFDTGTLTIDYSANGTVDDRLAIRNEGIGAGQIGVTGANVSYANVTIGTWAGGTGTTPLVITFNANSSAAATEALMRNITFANVSDDPATAARTVRFVLTDGDGGTSGNAFKTVTINGVNDAPTAANNTVVTNEDTTYVFTAADFNFSDLDSGDTLQQVQIISLPTAGMLKLAGADVTVNQVIPIAAINAEDLTFEPAPNQNGTGYATFDFKVSDGVPTGAAGTVLSSFSAPVVNSMSGLAFDGTNLWLNGQSTNTVYKLDSAGNVLSSFTGPGTNPTGLTFDGTNLWLVDRDLNTIFELDTLGNVLSSFATPGTDSRGLTFDGTNLWLIEGTGAQIYELTTTGSVVSSVAWPDDYLRGITWDGSNLWVADQNDSLIYEVNTSGTVLSSFAAPSTGAAGITFDGNDFWHADADTDTIYKLAGPNSTAFSVAAYTMAIDVTAINDNPGGSGTLTATSLNDNAGASNLFGDLTVTDVDSGENDLSLTVTLTDPGAGTLSGGGFTETGIGTGIYTVTGLTAAQAETTLDNLQFTPTDNSGPSGSFNTDIAVTVNDQGGGGERMVLSATTLSITRVNDNPTITSNGAGATAALNVAENNDAVTMVTVSDVDGGTPVYSITGGADELKFDIDPSSGALKFKTAPDFENPTDIGGDNIYVVEVTVDDLNTGTDVQTISVTVTNVAPVANMDGSWFDETDGGAGFASFSELVNAHANYLGTTEQTIDLESLTPGDVLASQFTGTHGVTFSNTGIGGSGVYSEGSGWIEDVTGYDGSYASDGSHVYLKMNNDVLATPFTIEFDTPVAKVGALLGMGKEGTDHSVTVSLYDAAGDLIDQQTLEAELWDPTSIDQNFETFFAAKFDSAIISKIEILNASNLNYANALIFDQLSWSHTPSATDSFVASTGVPLITGNVLANDADPAGGTISLTGFTQPTNGTVAYNGDGTFTYTSNNGYSGEDTFTYTISDGALSDVGVVTITVSNKAPTLTPSSPTLTTITEDQVGNSGDLISAILGSSVADPDNGAKEGIAITVLNSSNGTWQYNTGSGWTLIGTVSNANALLLGDADSIRFVPDGLNADSASFTYHAWDQTTGAAGTKVNISATGGSTAFSDATDVASITVTAVNDNPGGAGTLSTTSLNDNAGASNLFGGLTVTDVDAGESDLSLTVTLTDPTTGILSGGGFTETGLGTGIYTVTGLTAAQAETALDNLQFTPSNNTGPSGTFDTDIAVTVNDQGGGGERTVLSATTLSITRVNDNPGGAGTLTTTSLNDNSGAKNLFSGLSVTDVDAGESDLSLTVTLIDPTAGTLSGGGFTETGVGTGIYTVTGLTAAQAETALDNLQFTPTNNSGPTGSFNTDIAVTVNDQGGGGERTVLSATTLTITRVNDNPGGAGTLTTTSLNDNAGASNLFGGLTITDVDAGESDLSLTVTLTDPNAGTLSGGGFTETGVGTGIYTLTGLTPAQAETALDNLQFTPTNNSGPSGSFNTDIAVTVNDQGGGGERTVLSATTLSITRVNDNPGGAGTLTTTSLNDNAGASNLFGGLTVTDVDAGENDLSLTVTLTDPTAGTLSGGGFTETGVGTGIYTLSGLTAAQAETALDNLQFTPTNNSGPSGTVNTDIAVTVNDQGGGGERTVLSATTLSITRVNDNPSGAGTLTTTSLNDNAGASNLFGGLTVTDVDSGESDLSLTVTLTDPTAGILSGGGFTETGVGTGIYRVGGLTAAQAETALDNLQFTPTNNSGPSGTVNTDIAVTVNDQGGGGERTVLSATTLSITRVNDNPGGAGTLTTTGLNDNAGASNLFGGLTVTDVDSGESDLSLTVTLTDPNAGTLSGGGFTETGVGTGIYTLTGLTPAQAETALDNLQFTPTNNSGPSGSFNTDIAVTVNDQGGGGERTVLSATTLSITRVNDNPGGAGTLTTTSLNDNAGASNLFGGLTVTDVDAGESDLSLTVSLTDPNAGTLSGGGFTETGVGTGIYTLTGLTPAQAETALDNLQFTPTNNSGPTTVDFSITVNDQGGGGEHMVLSATTVTINGVNDDPIGGGTLTTTSLNDNAGASNLFGGLTVTDPDLGENDLSLSVTLSEPTAGTLSGGGFTETSFGSGIYTIYGLSAAQAKAALDNLQFTPTDNTGQSGSFNTDISVTVNDQGGGGERTVLSATTLTITRVNDDSIEENQESTPSSLIPQLEVSLVDTDTQIEDGPLDEQALAAVLAVTDLPQDSSDELQDESQLLLLDAPVSPVGADLLSQVMWLLDNEQGQTPETQNPTRALAAQDILRAELRKGQLGSIEPFAYEQAEFGTPGGVSVELKSEIDRMGTSFETKAEQAVSEQVYRKNVIQVTLGTLTAGSVTWLLRVGSLLTGVFTSIPLWSSIDPLPILSLSKKQKLQRQQELEDAGRADRSERRMDELLDAEEAGDGKKAVIT